MNINQITEKLKTHTPSLLSCKESGENPVCEGRWDDYVFLLSEAKRMHLDSDGNYVPYQETQYFKQAIGILVWLHSAGRLGWNAKDGGPR